MRAVRADWVWTPEGLVRGGVVAFDEHGRIGDPTGLPVEDKGGLILPGFINAHTHLELPPLATAPRTGGSRTESQGRSAVSAREAGALRPSSEGRPRSAEGIAGAIPPLERGFLPWVQQLRAGPPASAAQAGKGVYAAIRAGTAAVGEITNTGQSRLALSAAKMPARVWDEVFGIDVEAPPEVPHLTAHAPHSTHPNILRAAAATGCWSLHFDEDPEEARWLLDGTGAWRGYVERVGRRVEAFPIPGLSPAAYLAALGLLDRRVLLVHATCTRGADLDLVAAARVCLCVRSNLHITGRLPDVPGMIARGIPLAIGTDSLASSPDLDPLAEAVALRRAFPEVALSTWIRALTEGGADALALPLGRLQPGLAPGVLHVELPATDAPLDLLLDGTNWRRRWLACPNV